jgi:predicted amino acid racemase
MKYPALIINLNKIEHNTRLLADKCRKAGINVAAVSKVFCAIPEAAQAMVDGGAYMLADSRLENLSKLKDIKVPKMLLRLPMITDAEEVVDVCDISLNSEYETLSALSEAAIKKNTTHNVIIMTDLGDLREGVWHEHLLDFIGKIIPLKGIHIKGIGTNLTCYGGVIPDNRNLGALVNLAEQITEKHKIPIDIISGGNSSSLHLVFKDEIPSGINQLRLGESIVLGRETAFGAHIEGTYQDAFTLALEIIELKEKPSYPIGEIGMDAFGKKPVFEDKGIMLRCIMAAGRQDLNIAEIIPRDSNIQILGGSSDHLLADFTRCTRKYKVGDIVEFDLTYGGLLAASTSAYINKVIV